MSTVTVRSVVERFLKEPFPSVLVIRGKWGVGKTYFWRSCVDAFKSESSRRQYSYVSLFGLSSIRDLQISACVNSGDIANVRSPLASAIGAKTPASSAARAKMIVARYATLLPGSWGKTASFAIETMAPHLIRDTLVCLDDLERLPKTGVQFEEVLGFVSTLKEEKNCKVVLIFNDEELQDRTDIYRRYREKVVDIEVLFEPTVDEAADLAIPPDIQYRDLIRQKLSALEVRNIRLIRKALSNVALVLPLLGYTRQTISESVISMVVLLSWVDYDSGPERPTMDFLKQWNRLTWNICRPDKAKDKQKIDEAEEARVTKWSELLEKFGVSSFDNCDAAIARVITMGYTEDSGLAQEIAARNSAADAEETEERFTAAWRLYHDSFENNETEIVATIDRTFDAAAKSISPGNLDATVRLLRSFDRDDLADGLIERYVRIRGTEASLFDLEQWGTIGEIRDGKVKERFEAQNVDLNPPPPLIDVLRVLARRQGWSQEHIVVMNNATVDDLYGAFTSHLNRELNGIVRGCLNFANSEHNQITEKAVAALKRIAGESRINRLRVENKFGVTPD